MNPTEELVQANGSPVYQYVADHGQAITASIERVHIAGHKVSLSEEITEAERSLIREAIQSKEPTKTECFANALRMWKYNRRFKYAEGFAIPSHTTGEPQEFAHAWSMLDGAKIVDFTPEFHHHYGVIITSDDILEQCIGSDFTQRGIIGNHTNQYEFLRERGYYPDPPAD